MEVAIYVETNFLMSVALGREAQGDALLAAVTEAVRIWIPAGCYMESFSALEDEMKARNRFGNELDRQIGQLHRDLTSPHAKSLLISLDQSRVANVELVNDTKSRLFKFIDRARDAIGRIHESSEILHRSVSDRLIVDPTDNLILHSILEHARGNPTSKKAFLTDNSRDFEKPRVKDALAAVGIGKPFRNVDNLLGWLGTQA